MTTNIRTILERVDRGELDCETAVEAIKSREDQGSERKIHYLNVNVTRLHDRLPRVNIKIPLAMVGLGLALGSRFAPELEELDLDEIVKDLQLLGDGTILEVQDIKEDEHVLISIDEG